MPHHDIAPGTVVGGYTIESVIGRGGMGVVYLATQARLTRKVALKVLSPGLAHDEEFRNRFVREAELAAALEHPNLLPVYDAGEHGDIVYLAMRYVDGPDLRDVLLRAVTLTPHRCAEIASAVAGALDVAHARGLVHRDVKPGNILISRDGGHVYLSDFGLAKSSSGASLTRTGSFLGSVAYCSPEQIEGERLDGRADQYSLACVAFECLTGQPPFPRDSEVSVIKAHLSDAPPPVTLSCPELPPTVDQALQRALAKRPSERFESASRFAADLGTALHGQAPRPAAMRVQEPRAVKETLLERSPSDWQAPSPTTVEPPAKRRWGLVALAGAIGFAVVAGGAVAVASQVGGGDNEPAAKTTTASAVPPAPPAPPPVSQPIANRVEQISVAQERVNARLREITIDSTTLAAINSAGSALLREILDARRVSSGLTAANASGRTTLEWFVEALEAHEVYARALVHLPSDASALTSDEADEIVASGEDADAAYRTLSASAPEISPVPLSRGDNELLAIVLQAPAPSPPPPPPAPAPTPSPTPSPPSSSVSLTTYEGSAFSIAHPAHWFVETQEQKVSYGYSTTIRDPSSPETTYLRVDYTPNARVASAWDAALGQRNSTRGLPGYRELAFAPTTLAGYDAHRWEFERLVDGVLIRKTDIFLVDANGTGFAVLVQAPSSAFSSWQPVFDQIYASFSPR